MSSTNTLSAGFTDPVNQAQRAFRRVLTALSRPGLRQSIGSPVSGIGLQPAMAHLLLTLTDDDTPVWWQHQDAITTQWLRFHTSASTTNVMNEATFGVITAAATMPALDSFPPGSGASPEFSTTLLIEVPSLDDGPLIEWRGPGILDTHGARIAGLPATFWTQWQANHAMFPQGVDVLFCCQDQVIGLPRTTRVRRLEGV